MTLCNYNDKTRYMMLMITEVMYQMRWFLGVFILSLLLFSINFMKVDSNGRESYYEEEAYNDTYLNLTLTKGFMQTWDLANTS